MQLLPKASFLQNLCDALHFDPHKASEIHEGTRIYRQKLQQCVAKGELNEEDVSSLLRLRVLLCIPQQVVEAAHADICGRLFEKVVKDAIASGELEAKLEKPVQKEINLKDDLPERYRIDLYRTYLLFCLSGEVTVVPFGAQITTKKDNSEYLLLNQLGTILGLTGQQIVEVHRNLAEQAFMKQAEIFEKAKGVVLELAKSRAIKLFGTKHLPLRQRNREGVVASLNDMLASDKVSSKYPFDVKGKGKKTEALKGIEVEREEPPNRGVSMDLEEESSPKGENSAKRMDIEQRKDKKKDRIETEEDPQLGII
ncbi:hypothetical protein J5N97_022859 [Dioscorea zingiberensis]|uniref:Uncharacterized protein n=1 Tax=Dioscorea zingiberensis TaxID=325984 RepID=A0A9D5CB90_9LILI|nr:hypothetical protein J5N97_022859 [Dioscorea zingiberensis]